MAPNIATVADAKAAIISAFISLHSQHTYILQLR